MTPTLKRILRTLGTVLGWILLLLLIGIFGVRNGKKRTE